MRICNSVFLVPKLVVSLATYLKHSGSNNMPTEAELSKQSVPINKIPKYSVDWVMKVFVIRRGSIIPYKNARNEVSLRTIILVGEELKSFICYISYTIILIDFIDDTKSCLNQ